MSARQRRNRGRSLRLKVGRAKVLRRRARGAVAGPASAAVAALTMSAAGVLSGASVTTAEVRQARPGASAPSPSSRCEVVEDPSSYPSGFADVGGRSFFTAKDGAHGRELWASDGTEDGTFLVKDIYPSGYDSNPTRDVAVLRRTLFFNAKDGVHGPALWRSDGTRSGTVLVKDLDSGEYGRGPTALTEAGGKLFFTADGDASHKAELWTSDGTRSGTVLLRRIQEISPSSGTGPGRFFKGTEVGGRLFFAADDGTHGRQLWTSDGTRSGTVMVKEIRSGPYGGRPTDLTKVGRRLFFAASDDTHGRELWTSDGTRAGTVLVKDITRGEYAGYPEGAYPNDLAEVGGRLFFLADDGTHGRELWTSDGTRSGTVMVKDIAPGAYGGPVPGGYPGPSALIGVGDRLFFAADDRTHGSELWTSDGTRSGTVMVKDVTPGTSGPGAGNLTAVGDRVFFTRSLDNIVNTQLWTSDGTRAGTVLVDRFEDIDPRSFTAEPSYLTEVGGRLFFSADDGSHGIELWTSDGTEAGTRLVQNIDAPRIFTVGAHGRVDTRNGRLRTSVTTLVPGELVIGPARRPLIRRTTQDAARAGRIEVTLKPTAAGKRKLRRDLRQALRHGRDVGELRVEVRFAFTSCGGTVETLTRKYTLRLR